MENNIIQKWFLTPSNLMEKILCLLPLIISQGLQRVYQIVDGRYASELGQQALLIHSVQYNFTAFGQLIGAATAISCLVFWKRDGYYHKQKSIFSKHIILTFLLCFFCALVAAFFSKNIISLYKINPLFVQIGCIYLWIGLGNMVLQAVYGSLDGMLIASNQQHMSMLISLCLVISKLAFDVYAVDKLFAGGSSPSTIYYPLLIICLSNTLLLVIACLISCYLVIKKTGGNEPLTIKEVSTVWCSEIGVYFIRAVIPFFYSYQLTLIMASAGFFATYQLVFHVSYIACLPVIAAVQLAVREAAVEFSAKNENSASSEWRNNLFYTGLLPTIFMLFVSAFFYDSILKFVYNYIVPADQAPFIPLFFIACVFGQIGTALTVQIRAQKANYLVTISFFINQIIILIGGTQILITLNVATPGALGWLMIVYCISQILMNLGSIKLINKGKNNVRK